MQHSFQPECDSIAWLIWKKQSGLIEHGLKNLSFVSRRPSFHKVSNASACHRYSPQKAKWCFTFYPSLTHTVSHHPLPRMLMEDVTQCHQGAPKFCIRQSWGFMGMAISMRKPPILVRLFDLSPLLFVLLRQKTGVYAQCPTSSWYGDKFVWNIWTVLDISTKRWVSSKVFVCASHNLIWYKSTPPHPNSINTCTHAQGATRSHTLSQTVWRTPSHLLFFCSPLCLRPLFTSVL